MLLGRGRECGAIDRVLRSTAPAEAAVLMLRGPAGVGKSALLEWAAASSSRPALWLRCTEGQQHLRWSALRELVKLLDAGLDGLIPWQRDTLDAALNGAAADPLAVGASLVALLSISASVRPLLILIDDAQWIDDASRAALRFAARRIDYDPVVLLMAEAVEETSDETVESLPVLMVHGLSPIDAVTLLEGQVGTKVAEELARVTEGNPLAMLEIARGLTPAQRSGAADLGSVVPLSEVLLRSFERRTAGLSDEQRRLLVLAAAEPDLDPERLRAATAEAGIDPALVETVVASGVLQRGTDGKLRFARPLLRDAVYQSADPDDRRLAHRALAAVSTGAAEVDRRAWHLSAAADGPDPEAARALEALAVRAGARGDARAAGAALRRAAALSAEPRDQIRRLAAAGNAYALGDLNEQAIVVLEAALELTEDPRDLAEIQIALAGPRLAASGSPRGYRELARLSDQVRGVDAGRAASLNTFAALMALSAGELHRARALCRLAIDGFPTLTGRSARMAVALHGLLSALAGDRETAATELLEFREPDGDVWRGQSTLIFEDLVAAALTWVGEVSAASRLVASLVERSRETNALGLLARALVVRADLYLRTGYWDAALADANESAEFAIDLGAGASAAFALAVMARLEAGKGRVAEARRHGLEALATAERSDLAVNAFWAQGALGFLALGEGNGPEAVSRLESARAFAEREGIGLMVVVPWAPDLVEAYARTGQTNEAAQLVEALDAQDVGSQGPLAQALLARSRGLVAAVDADRHFDAAIAAHTAVLSPFERARTLLVYGEWLRRERRAAEAISRLEEAAVAFDRLGAVAWHARATAELDAHGRRSPAVPRGGRRALTPQEFRVARTVAGGATNREAAAVLFLSPRTVEHHLAAVYRKLGIRSRSELTRRVLSDPNFSVQLDAAIRDV